MNTGEGRSERQLAPALTGREQSDQDPPVMEQWVNEIRQATERVDSQMCRLRNYTDSIFGSQPIDEPGNAKEPGVAEVVPHYDIVGRTIRDLHKANDRLTEQLDRLEGHRLV